MFSNSHRSENTFPTNAASFYQNVTVRASREFEFLSKQKAYCSGFHWISYAGELNREYSGFDPLMRRFGTPSVLTLSLRSPFCVINSSAHQMWNDFPQIMWRQQWRYNFKAMQSPVIVSTFSIFAELVPSMTKLYPISWTDFRTKLQKYYFASCSVRNSFHHI